MNWISYGDSEVNVFHPICEEALNRALDKLNLSNSYRVLHHQYTGSLEMDFVIQNTNTGKYLCVIEVKRTPQDVHSARYQYQAMSYVQMNAAVNEKPFYILTNLEYAFFFRYDPDRPRVFQQMLEPGLTHISDFANNNKSAFMDSLADYFTSRLSECIQNNYKYLMTLSQFAEHMEAIKNDSKKWKTHLAVMLYEYIRGSFTAIKRNDLHDIRLFHDDVMQICSEAIKVNFRDIFSYSDNEFEQKSGIANNILSDLFKFGEQNISGDSIAGILHQIASSGQEHEGEVPTDLELGMIISELAKHELDRDLADTDLVCDPAAGSGNLVTTAISRFNLTPKQILVNDVNPKLLELLSLRLGLNYATIISKDNSVKILNENISNLEKHLFNNVKVVVLNPPFVAGIQCVDKKPPLYGRIHELSGARAITKVGQMPLEAVFLELVVNLVPKGTVIACVFPKAHLNSRGQEAIAIRKMLIHEFGLRVVFTYPENDIFNNVTVSTCTLVGVTHKNDKTVKVISSYSEVPDLDIEDFTQSLDNDFSDDFAPLIPGVVSRKVSTFELIQNINDGWRELNSEMIEAIDFVKMNFKESPKFSTLETLGYDLKRGTAGNNGGSDVLFVDYEHKPSELSLSPSMRNAKYSNFQIDNGDSGFLDARKNKKSDIIRFISQRNSTTNDVGRQEKIAKSSEDIYKIVENESRQEFPKNSVLIPRAIRKEGKAYFANRDLFVSTNFLVCTPSSYREAILLSSWMNTVFYQLICEVSSTDQAGMRKMEVKDIRLTYVPDFSIVTDDDFKNIEESVTDLSFIVLKSPESRSLDEIWAKIIFGKDSDHKLSEAIRMLKFLANRRDSQ